MALKAVFFDVGDTLVEHWSPREVLNKHAREQICADLGEFPWLDDLLAAELEPVAPLSFAQQLASGQGARFAPETSRQDTLAWLRQWFDEHGISVDGVDLDRLRSLMCVPLAKVSTPVPGAFDAVRWCAERGLRVVLVTNTLQRGDAEVLEDWQRYGLTDTIEGVVSSHSAGWRKPHPAIFERALEIARVEASDAAHVGDNLIADVVGAKQLGMRAVWRRTPGDIAEDRRSERMTDRSDCQHPSDFVGFRDGSPWCRRCGSRLEIRVQPDAIVDDLTELPAVLGTWLDDPA